MQCSRSYARLRGQNYNGFLKLSLPVRSDRAAPCPFDPSMCVETTKSFLLDSDWNSWFDLVLNQDLYFRQKRSTHCFTLIMNTLALEFSTDSSINRSIKIESYGFKNGAFMFEGTFNATVWMYGTRDYVIT